MTETSSPVTYSDPNRVEAVNELLSEVVRRVTGLPNPEPRPGQIQLAHAAAAVLSTPAEPVTETTRPAWETHHTIGVAPTGTGKAIAGLVPAALQACRGRRTLFSTESLSLQSQIIDKDFPVVADATEALFGYRPSIAVHKGFANFLCAKSVVDRAAEKLDVPETDLDSKMPRDRPKYLAGVLRDKAMWAFMQNLDIDLFQWALDQCSDPEGDPGKTGDKSTYEGFLADDAWQDVSVSSEDCIKEDCPFFSICLPVAAREVARDADIVVTNHALLGVQAAKQVPVVVGSKALGEFTGVVVDEAHALPGWVRSQGATSINAKSVQTMARRVETYMAADGELQTLLGMVATLTTSLEGDLAAAVKAAAPRGARPSEALEVKVADALPSSGDSVEGWCGAVEGKVRSAMKSMHPSSPQWLPLNRLANQVKQMQDNVEALRFESSGQARWLMVEPPRGGDTPPGVGGRGRSRSAAEKPFIVLQSSPVDVSNLLRNNLWSRPAADGAEWSEWKRGGQLSDDSLEEAVASKQGVKATMGVVAMSATMPVGFGRQAGLAGRTHEYESPFDRAYQESLAFIPAMTAADEAALTRPGGRGMDTKAHHEWATPRIVELVQANQGSALVLAATSANGRNYAAALRLALAGTGITVHSQWDGLAMRQVVAAWRDDVSSVLVGTRSMMTGVDAPGRTCSLVVLDRIPRSAGNPVDDARVKLLVDEGVADNKWDGDRFVYVADARLLMEQALGRLIRSISDVGMAAVLDPRLLKSAGRMAYNERARKMLLKPMLRFPNRVTDMGEAKGWLAAHAANHAATVTVN